MPSVWFVIEWSWMCTVYMSASAPMPIDIMPGQHIMPPHSLAACHSLLSLSPTHTINGHPIWLPRRLLLFWDHGNVITKEMKRLLNSWIVWVSTYYLRFCCSTRALAWASYLIDLLRLRFVIAVRAIGCEVGNYG